MLIVTATVYGKREPMNTNNVENYNERYTPKRETYVIKKDGSLEAFHVQKVIDAIGKSAYRALTKFTPEEKEQICECVISHIDALNPHRYPSLSCTIRGKCPRAGTSHRSQKLPRL